MTTQSSFNDTLRQMWDTRPPRIPSEQGGNAKIAGVCEGIGVRYQIDPTIIRVLFVVSLFTLGGGLPAYLLAWMFMPRYGMAVSPAQAVSRRGEQLSTPELKERSTGWWLLIFFLLTSGIFTAGGTLASTGVLAILVLLAAWWALHQRTPQPPAGLLADTPDRTMPAAVDLSSYLPAEGTDVPPGRVNPPAWDPLATAPFAWDLPEPGPAPQPTPRRPRIWPWVALGLIGTLGAATIVAGIIGTNMSGSFDDIAQPRQFAPVGEAELQDSYSGGIGDLVVDLRGLPALDAAHTTIVDGGIGPVDVFLPDAVPVELSCSEGIGESTCIPGTYNEDATGATLNLHVEGGIGPVRVN